MSNEIGEVGYVMPSGKVEHIPSAHSVRLCRCDEPSCGALHLFLLDQVGQPIAEATLSEEFAAEILRAQRRGR